jgi:hypothetical protein
LSRARHGLRAAIVVASTGIAASSALGGASSCASAPDSGRLTQVIEPDFAAYRDHVDVYLGRRCGTLDCHGQQGRGYRIYGREGFRDYTYQVDDAGLVSGQQPTVPQEVLANFQALIALEPEEMSRVMARQGEREAVQRLVFVRKPLRLERHKGGPAMAEDDPGYRCIEAWLQIPVVRGDGSFIPPEERAPMPERAVAFCEEAASFP